MMFLCSSRSGPRVYYLPLILLTALFLLLESPLLWIESPLFSTTAYPAALAKTTTTTKPVDEESDAMDALRVFATTLLQNSYSSCANLTRLGSGWGGHVVCADLLSEQKKKNCNVLSYGIDKDYSFDLQMQARWNCTVIALDPTVTHPSMLGPGVFFQQWAAPSKFVDLHPELKWIVVSPIGLADLLFKPGSSIAMLKMDCEGCEYSLYRALVESGQMDFFSRVDQFAVEVHLAQVEGWLDSNEQVVQFGMLLRSLDRAGLKLVHAEFTACNPRDERLGCHASLKQTGYPCEKKKMCQNFLFARVANQS
jgi:hypothetical protein